MPIDDALVANADAVCRTMLEEPGLSLIVVDARGGGRVNLFYRGTGDTFADCLDVVVNPAGDVAAPGAGEFFRDPALDRLAARELAVSSLFRGPAHAAVFGRAGGEISTVIIEEAVPQPVVASIRDGYYAAWWPGRLRGTIKGYDANGLLVAERTVSP